MLGWVLGAVRFPLVLIRAAIDRIGETERNIRLAKELRACADENAGLRRERDELQEALKFKTQLVYRNNVYWLGDGDDESSGPCCPTCWQDRWKVMRMTRTKPGWGYCHVCRRSIQFGESPPEATRRSGASWVNGWRR